MYKRSFSKNGKLFLIAFIVFLFSICSVSARDVSLIWDMIPEDTGVDNTLNPVDHYTLYWSESPRPSNADPITNPHYVNQINTGLSTIANAVLLTPGKKYYFAVTASSRERSGYGSESDYSEEISYEVPLNVVGPEIYGGYPNGRTYLPAGYDSLNVRFNTNIASECRYSETPEVDFDNMIMRFFTDDRKYHFFENKGLKRGMKYNYYVRCKDHLSGNIVNDKDYVISFFLENDFSGNKGIKSGVEYSEDLIPNTDFLKVEVLGLNALDKNKILGGSYKWPIEGSDDLINWNTLTKDYSFLIGPENIFYSSDKKTIDLYFGISVSIGESYKHYRLVGVSESVSIVSIIT